jgi:hypothetical protein
MGIIVLENYQYNEACDVNVSNYYVNIKEIIIEGTVKLTYSYQSYSSKDARENNKLAMSRNVKEVLINGVIPSDLYAFVYTDLKTMYSSYIDS